MDTMPNNLENLEDITPEDSACPIYRIELTQDQIDEMEILHNESLAIAQEQQNKESAKQSALAKLAALGLTEEEAKAVIGI